MPNTKNCLRIAGEVIERALKRIAEGKKCAQPKPRCPIFEARDLDILHRPLWMLGPGKVMPPNDCPSRQPDCNCKERINQILR